MAIFFQSTSYLKVLLSPTVRQRPEIEALSPEQVVLLPSSLVTPKMEKRPELDSPVAAEEPSQDTAELWLESLLEVAEPISPS